MSSSARPYGRLGLFYLFYFALVGILLPYWSLYLRWLDYSAAEIGWVAAVLMVTRMGAPNLWGWLADRRYPRLRLIQWGCFAALLAFSGLLLSQRLVWMLCLVFAFSFFWNAVLAQFEVLTLQHLYPHTGRYGLVRIWGSLGFILAVLGLGFALERISPNWIPWLCGNLFLCLWLASLALPSAPAPVEAIDEPAEVRLACPQLWLFLLIMFLLQLAHGPYYTFYTLYLQDAGWAEGHIGLLWSLGVVAEIFIFLCMHVLLAQVSLLRLLCAAVLLTATRWVLIARFPEALSMLILAQLLHAASFGVAHAVAIEWVRRRFPTSQAGQGQALYSSISFGAGGAAGALLSGLFWDISPAGVFYVAASVALLALLFIAKLQEPIIEKK